MSKIANTHLRTSIIKVLEGSKEKKREFLETIELQIGLKNYDPQKDKRFAGNIKLPHIPRPKMRICVLGDAFHCEKSAALGIDHKNADGLKNFNKNKKLIKKFGARRRPPADTTPQLPALPPWRRRRLTAAGLLLPPRRPAPTLGRCPLLPPPSFTLPHPAQPTRLSPHFLPHQTL